MAGREGFKFLAHNESGLKVRAAGVEAEGSPGEPVDGIDARRTQRMQYKMALSRVSAGRSRLSDKGQGCCPGTSEPVAAFFEK